MARELITSWGEYQAAIDRLLALAVSQIRIYDADLGQLRLDSPKRQEQIRRVLGAGRQEALHIAIRDGDPVRREHPQLLKLLTTYCHIASARQTPEHLGHLRDSMIIVDGRHALVRFENDQARSKLLVDEIEEVRPYLLRFNEIWTEGGEQVNATALGL